RAALLDAKKLGLSLSVIVLVKTNQHDKSWLENFRDAVQAMPEIMGAHRMTGELDYMLQIRVTDMEAYDSFYRRLIDLVPIADVSASFVMEDLKETTELPL
ncbi:MAG: Lrp/AsnC family transcriptional regulator, partial [Alphaproteobacteria bacterium]